MSIVFIFIIIFHLLVLSPPSVSSITVMIIFLVIIHHHLHCIIFIISLHISISLAALPFPLGDAPPYHALGAEGGCELAPTPPPRSRRSGSRASTVSEMSGLGKNMSLMSTLIHTSTHTNTPTFYPD